LRKKLASRYIDNKKLFSIDQLLDGLGAAVLKSIRAPFGIFDIDYRVIWANRAMAWIHQKEPEEIIVKLSRRETEILRLIAEGYTNLQISELLSISQNTVKSHVNHIFNKLGVNDRTQAAVLATRYHLL
jgi:DNA-binding NarL/FixJ family response regulator